jgi:hypothetical protein
MEPCQQCKMGLFGFTIEHTLTNNPTPLPIREFFDFIVNKKFGRIKIQYLKYVTL